MTARLNIQRYLGCANQATVWGYSQNYNQATQS